MSRILFVQALNMEHLGLMMLSSLAKSRGHEVVATAGTNRQVVQLAKGFKPHVVAVSVMSIFEKKFLALARMLKQSLSPAPLIIFGGIHPTFFPQIVLSEEVDVAVRGEGEGAFMDILDAVESGAGFSDIKNVAIKINGETHQTPLRPLVELDSVPFCDRELLVGGRRLQKQGRFFFNAGRGCPYNCAYCYSRQMKDLYRGTGPFVRWRSIENLLAEIDFVNRRYGVRDIVFADDNFVFNEKWIVAFLEEYASRFRIPFLCNFTADRISPEIAQALQEAGCQMVIFGVESGVETLRSRVLNKKISNDDILKAASILNAAGIPFGTYNMFGIPGERLEDAWATINFNIEIKPAFSWGGLFQPFPETDLAKFCAENGLLREPLEEEVILNPHTQSLLRQPEIEEVTRLHKYFYVACHFPGMRPFIRRLIKRDLPRTEFIIYKFSFLWLFFKRFWGFSFFETLWKGFQAFLYEFSRDKDSERF